MGQRKYDEIYKLLLADIEKGKYANGKFPSENQLVRRFGVARMTVNRAVLELRKRGYLTRHRGQGSFLSRRAEHSSGLIGFLGPGAIHMEYYTPVEMAFTECARQFGGFRVIVESDTDEVEGSSTKKMDHVVSMLVDQRVEGVAMVVFSGVEKRPEYAKALEAFKKAGIPVVLMLGDIAPYPQRSGMDGVCVDYCRIGHLVGDMLFRSGCRRLLAVGSGEISSMGRLRMFGLRNCISLHGAKSIFEDIVKVEPDDVDAVRSMMRRMKPDALVCTNDTTAVKMMKSLAVLGYRVPDDVKVVGYGDSAASRYSSPTLTTVRVPYERLARTAFRILHMRITGAVKTQYPISIIHEAELRLRESTGHMQADGPQPRGRQ